MTMFITLYDHDPRDLRDIHIAITSGGVPTDDQWLPAYRDTMRGQRVVWVRSPLDQGDMWVKDTAHGVRKVKRWISL